MIHIIQSAIEKTINLDHYNIQQNYTLIKVSRLFKLKQLIYTERYLNLVNKFTIIQGKINI